MARQAFICDLDGTLCNNAHRRHLVEHKPKMFAKFHDACVDDIPNLHVKIVYRALREAGYASVLTTGRPDSHMDQTLSWLERWQIDFDQLIMRPVDNKDSDECLKRGYLQQIIEMGWNPILALDDRTRIVNTWRRQGVPCFQVAPGDF